LLWMWRRLLHVPRRAAAVRRDARGLDEIHSL